MFELVEKENAGCGKYFPTCLWKFFYAINKSWEMLKSFSINMPRKMTNTGSNETKYESIQTLQDFWGNLYHGTILDVKRELCYDPRKS